MIIVEEPFDWLSVSETKAKQALEELAKHAEQIKKHAASVLNRVANAAKQAGVSCVTIQVENEQPYKAIIATAADRVAASADTATVSVTAVSESSGSF